VIAWPSDDAASVAFFFQRWPEIARSRLLGIERILLFSTLEGTETQATLPQWTSP
jgi:hypothetical protein